MIRETPFLPSVERHIDFSELQWQAFKNKTKTKKTTPNKQKKPEQGIYLADAKYKKCLGVSCRGRRPPGFQPFQRLPYCETSRVKKGGKEGGKVIAGWGLQQRLGQGFASFCLSWTLGVTLHKSPSTGGGRCRCWTWLKHQQCRFQGQRTVDFKDRSIPFGKEEFALSPACHPQEKNSKNKPQPTNHKTPFLFFF